MATPSTNISVTAPVSQAIDRVKLLLFRPFDLGKWFTIGFCAWLAHLGEAGFNMNYRLGSRRGGSLRHEWDQAREYMMNNLYWILPLAVAVMFIGLACWVVFTWLSSRAKFMFLHCVALEKAEVGEPWHKFTREGNSLFVFRLVLGLIAIVPMLPLMAIAIVAVMRMVSRGGPDIRGILVLVGAGLMLVMVAMVFLVAAKLTTDFVVPIMFLRRTGCLAGWRELLGLISINLTNFVLYLLFQVVLAMATGAFVLIAIIATCCIACCVIMIPYLGTVLLLPILVFNRSYSLHYLVQYGPEYDVFTPVSVPTGTMLWLR